MVQYTAYTGTFPKKGGRMMREKKSGVMHFPQSVRIAIFILIFIVLLTVYVCLFQMIQQSAEAGRQRARELETVFTLTQEKTDAQFSALYQIAASAHSNQTLRKVSLREYNVIDEMNAIDELEKLIAANPLFDYAYYYVRETQVLFKRSGICVFPESEPYFLPFEGIDAMEIRRILTGEAGGDKLYLLPALKSVNSSSGDVLVAVLPTPYNSASPYATLMVEIGLDRLWQMALPTGIGQETVFAMYRADGTLLFSSGDAAFASLGRVSPEGRGLFEMGGETFQCFRAQNYGTANLTYEMYVPERVMNAGMLSSAQMKLIFIGCVVLLLLLCPVLYVWTYQPMRLLIEKLSIVHGEKPGHMLIRDDYAIALREIEQLRMNNSSLLWKIDTSMNLVRASLIRNLLEYGKTSEAFFELCERADLSFQYPHFRLVLITAKAAEPQTDISKYIKLTREGVDVYAVKAPDMLYVLVNARNPAEVSTYSLVSNLADMQVTEEIDQLYFARSAWTEDPTQLHFNYRRTLDKLSQKIFHGALGLTEETEIQHERETAVRPYPINEMLKLRESAMDLDKGKMREAVMDIQRYLLHESTKNTMAVLAAVDVLQILQRYTEADMSVLLERVRKKGAAAVEVCQALRESVEMIEEASARQSADTLTEEMMVYISEMLESPNLSSATVSEHFGMSESAFSHAFKKRTGGTFTKYVTDLKIQRAKSLLICTDLSVEAIADRLNYASASSFARMFKSETALTPTQYRKLSGNGDNS